MGASAELKCGVRSGTRIEMDASQRVLVVRRGWKQSAVRRSRSCAMKLDCQACMCRDKEDEADSVRANQECVHRETARASNSIRLCAAVRHVRTTSIQADAGRKSEASKRRLRVDLCDDAWAQSRGSEDVH
ncbi:hypothetical protein L1887_47889 [Cichorium endivia]|nr:hypothetical protein L1887_47889 [Cichorium endivia]